MRTAVLFAFFSLVAGDGENCNVGVTIEGLQQLDGDWIAEILEDGQATGFIRKSDLPKMPDAPELQQGCYFCSPRVNNTWVIAEGAHLVATCTQGCPDTKNWPRSGMKETQWLIAETNKTATVASSCCKRKAQECDVCDEQKCRSHTSLSSCVSASTLGGCCTAAGWLDEGICKCQETAVECDHSATHDVVV